MMRLLKNGKTIRLKALVKCCRFLVLVGVALSPLVVMAEQKKLVLVVDNRKLVAEGVVVEGAGSDEQNFKKLVRDTTGSVLTTSITAEKMNEDPALKDLFVIHATPFSSQSYYLAFARNSSVGDVEKKQIWREIKRWRDDYVFMNQVFGQY